jgi:hypothetical protein
LINKAPLNIYVDFEIKRWFSEHEISPSEFFESAWNQYVDSDVDTKSKILIGKISILRTDIKRLEDELEETTGKRFEQLTILDSPIIDMRSREEQGMEALYKALSDDQKRVLDGKATFSHMSMTNVENWIDARKQDFGLVLPTRKVLEKLRDNGHAQSLCAEKDGHAQSLCAEKKAEGAPN